MKRVQKGPENSNKSQFFVFSKGSLKVDASPSENADRSPNETKLHYNTKWAVLYFRIIVFKVCNSSNPISKIFVEI